MTTYKKKFRPIGLVVNFFTGLVQFKHDLDYLSDF